MLAAHLNWLKASNLSTGERNFFLKNEMTVEEDGYILPPKDLPIQERRISFWLPEHEKQVFMRNENELNSRSDLFDSLKRKSFLPLLSKKIQLVWPEHGEAVFGRSLDPKVRLRTSFMEFAHKQLLQNVMCHAYGNVSHNSNYNSFTLDHYQQLGKDFLFSSIAYLDISMINPMEDSFEKAISELNAIHPKLGEYYSQKWKKIISERSRILLFSYCDIGPGIERHLTQFGPQEVRAEEEISTKEIIDGRMTGRNTFGSGQGLYDVRNLAKDSEARLVFETPNSIYYSDPSNNEDCMSEPPKVPRGTSVSVVVEM